MSNNNNKSFTNCCVQFLEDPWSTVKVLVPTVAIEVILHKQVWQRTSLRDLTLYLALANTYWFATTLNLSFLETPLFLQSPHLDDQQKLDCGRQRFNWLNKIEAIVSVVGLDLYCEWRKRIIDHNGFVDRPLANAIWIPVAVTAIQAVYFLPKLNQKAKVINKTGHEGNFPNIHRAYIGFETVKLAGLVVAGLRFGRMLTI